MSLDDPGLVRAQYASEAGLEARMRAWRDYREGPDVREAALEAIAEARPRRVLEVGCGTGIVAARLAAGLGAEVTGIDTSERMVELTRARGVDARVADVQELPFADGTFDVVAALWMLYHVPDLERGLGEIARVLRPGGRLVAVTLSDRQLAELWRLVGADQPRGLSFSAENGGERLRRHFARVEERPMECALLFPDHAAARDYVAASITRAGLAERLAPFEGPLRAHARQTVFVAHTLTPA